MVFSSFPQKLVTNHREKAWGGEDKEKRRAQKAAHKARGGTQWGNYPLGIDHFFWEGARFCIGEVE